MTDFATWERASLISFCQTSAKKMTELRNGLAQAKIYAPAQRAKPMPKTDPVGKTNFAFFGLIETDDEFAASGKPYVETVE